jgi:hypothetical protein
VVQPKLPEPPSFYVRRQGHVTFGNDGAGVANRSFTGIEPLLLASDYPHPERDLAPHRETLDHVFAGVPAPERDLVTYATTARLYGLKAPVA